MPLFSDTIEHGSTNGRYHACRINGARSVTVDRNKELHARINHKDALRRMSNAYGEWVPTSTYSVGVPREMVRLGCRCHAPARDRCESDAKLDS